MADEKSSKTTTSKSATKAPPKDEKDSKAGDSKAQKDSVAGKREGDQAPGKHAGSGDASSKNVHATDPTLTGVDKALEEVRKVREDNERRARLHNRTVIQHEVAAFSKDGNEKTKPIELTAAGQKAYLNTHGEAVLDQEGLIDLSQKIQQLFQAVS